MTPDPDPAQAFIVLLAQVLAAALAGWLAYSVVRGLLHRGLRPLRRARERRRAAMHIIELVRSEYEAVVTSPDRHDEAPALDNPDHPATLRFRAALAAVALLETGRSSPAAVEDAAGELAASWQHLQDREHTLLPGRCGEVRAELLRYRVDTGERTVYAVRRLRGR